MNKGQDDKRDHEQDGCVQPHLDEVQAYQEEPGKDSSNDAGILKGGNQEPRPLVGGIVPEYATAIASRVLGETQEGKEEERTCQYQ